MKKKVFAILFGMVLAVEAIAQISVSPESSEGAFPLVTADGQAVIVYDAADAEVVGTVARCLADDIKAVTGKNISVKSVISAGDVPVIAGTLGQSEIIDEMAENGKIDAAAVQGKWEVYGLQLVDNPAEGVARALVVYGSTPRGTAYGLLELSRQMGVSP